MKRQRFALSVLVLILLSGATAVACNVPVFRYALERWRADAYEVLILHQGELDTASAARLQSLKNLGKKSSANMSVRSVDVNDNQIELITQLWKEHGHKGEPVMAVLYPARAQEVPNRVASVSPFSSEAVERLTDSPVRRQLAKKLLSGDSAVWIFVPSGHKDLDVAAKKRLTEHLEQNQDQLELPPQDELEADEFFLKDTPIELRVSFSIVTLDRNDSKERFVLDVLLGSESDLRELDEPMAFPVIGRGRVLYALVGKGIFRDTITMASSFVVGPCSCQVKDQNPGFDLLLSVDWEKEIGGSMISEPLPDRPTKRVLLEIPPGK